ncbi:MAG TPA: hypothetical protein VL654_09930 [Casimicrobiaceae bacterium]|jgi:hypothetical protein|nr:hypothetical protein [Casimicrobiaceae bacterium]
MDIQRNISRVLAAAVASGGFIVGPMPVHAATLTCTSTSFTASADGSGNITVNCTSPSTGGSTCSISVSPTSLPASGGTVNVSANCGATPSVTGGKSVTATSTSTWTDAIPANAGSTSLTFTYTVNGANGTDSKSVVQAGTSTGGTGGSPPPGTPISCPGYSKTIVLDLNWGAPGSAAPRLTTSAFGNDAIVVARFTTPANTAPGVFASISSGEWGDQPTARDAALSTTACDFPSPNPLGRYATLNAGQQTPSVVYAVGGTSRVYAILQPSTTYYFNVKNVNALGAPSCTGSTCNIFVELQKPNGL